MRRVVVLGGAGFFGAAAVERLRAEGVRPLVASRRPGAALRVDADSRPSLKAALRPLDVVLDAAGPFQRRTTALVETAIETGIDVVDLSDSLGYSGRVADLGLRIEAAGIRVLTACSAVSALSATAVLRSGVKDPARLSVFLRPASGATAHRATAASLLESVGRPIRAWRAGRLMERTGWRESRRPRHAGAGRPARTWLAESPDALFLPRLWPSLKQIDFWVDTRVPGLNHALRLAAAFGPARGIAAALLPLGTALCRLLGPRSGGVQYEIEAADGSVVTIALVASRRSHLAAIAPAVLATRAIAQGRPGPAGLVPPDRQVDAGELFDYLGRLGIDVATVRHGRREP